MIRLRLLGNPTIVGNDGSVITGPATQRHRIALLALLAISAEQGHSRDKLMPLLWSDRDTEHSRQLLNQAVYNLRKALGDDALVSDSDSLRLNSELIETDVAEFEAALARGANSAAVGLYHGPFIDGLFLSDAPEFERWTDRERARLAAKYAKALESLAESAEAARDFEQAVSWWKSRAAHDPYDSRIALRLMQALDASGNRAGALQQAAMHQRMLQEEFGTQPAAAVTEYAERLRREPAVTIPGVVDHPTRVETPDAVEASGAVVPELGRRPSVRIFRYGVAALVLFVVVAAIIWARPDRNAIASQSPSERSIAVLPLANQSVDPRDAVLADGMTDELIAILAKDTALRVIGSTSVSAYRDRPVDVRSVAETLGVAHVLEGGLQKAGDRLRVRVRLVDARDGSTRWAETYDRDLRDVFAVQDEIAHAVARELGVRLGLPNLAVVRRQPTRDVAAYEFYLKGSDRTLLRSDSAVRVGLEFFRQAIALDSNYAGAWAGLGRMYSRLAAVAPPRDHARLVMLGEEAARKAVALDDSLDETHATLGAIRMSRRDFAGAERELLRAIALDPNNPITHQWISALYISTGQLDKALAHAERALALDPLAPDARADLARALVANNRCDEALVHLRPLASLKPPLLRVAPIAAQCYAKKGMWPEAIAAMRPQVQRGEPTAQAHLAYLLGRAGQKDEALRIRTALLERWRRGEIGAFQVALSYAGLGEIDRAFEWLDRSVDDGSFEGSIRGQFRALLSEQLGDDPRFVRLQQRLGFRIKSDSAARD